MSAWVPTGDCRRTGCSDRAQHTVRLETAGGDTDLLALCALDTAIMIHRDRLGKVAVIGP